MKTRSLFTESFIATILIFVIVLLLFQLINVSFKPFNYVVKAIKEFNLNDLYFSALSNDMVDTNIVVVNIEHIGRDGITELLVQIAESEPAVIGLDVFFTKENKTPYDSLMAATMHRLKDKLVLPVDYNQQQEPNPNYWSFDESYNTGHAGILTNVNNTAIVREFEPYLLLDNERVWSFAAKIATRYKIDASRALEQRKRSTEIINYIGNMEAFRTFHHQDVMLFSEAERSMLRDKIVLIGYYGGRTQSAQDLEDIFFTPVGFDGSINRRPDMFGVIIHANIVSMILNERYIRTIPKWAMYLLTFLITFIHVVLFTYFYVMRHMYYHTFAKIMLLFSSVLLLLIVFLLFSKYYIYFPAKYLILPVVLSVDVLYLYESMALMLYKTFRIRSVFVHH